MILAEHVPTELFKTDLQYGAFALCALVIAILGLVVWQLLKIVKNHLTHINCKLGKIQHEIENLPCERGVCPEESG